MVPINLPEKQENPKAKISKREIVKIRVEINETEPPPKKNYPKKQ
jgi:hypothetical protein